MNLIGTEWIQKSSWCGIVGSSHYPQNVFSWKYKKHYVVEFHD